MTRRSIGFPLAIGITLMVLALVLAIGWQVLVVGDLGPVTRGLTTLHWVFLILGSVFFVLIIVGLLLLLIWLVREIRSNQRQQAFLDAVTHEMKTPLASLRLYVETLVRHDPGEERRRAFLARMEQDVERLERTVNQVLMAARAEVRPGTPDEVSDLTELVGQAAEEIRQRHHLDEAAIQLDRRRPLVALGDRGELEVVFRNLLENAVKYSDRPVAVRVSFIHAADRAEVVITDEGQGIEPADLNRVFDRFTRVGRDVQRQAGLGLGLFIVWNLIRKNGGRVMARSKGLGRGSAFRVVLRAADASIPIPAQAGCGLGESGARAQLGDGATGRA